jgi:hypothetical protein
MEVMTVTKSQPLECVRDARDFGHAYDIAQDALSEVKEQP